MAERIRTVGVIGAGVMGSSIAAHLANAGILAHLLDVLPLDLAPNASAHARNALANRALERTLATKPAAFLIPDAARRITPGNLDDHLSRLSECDLVIEAVVENLELKQGLFARIAPYIRHDAILASNTSGLDVARLVEALPAPLAARFLVLHFFNPVRYTRLLEIVPAPSTTMSVLERMRELGERLGKGVIVARNTPNFVANRIGVHALLLTMQRMVHDNLDIETVDLVVGTPMGRPKSGAFGAADLVGLDTLGQVVQHCFDSLADDPARPIFALPDFVTQLIASGHLGRKSGAGFYKKTATELLVYDRLTREYRLRKKPRFASLEACKSEPDPALRLKKLVWGSDAAADFAWATLSGTLRYSAELLGDVTDEIPTIDRAMCWGFNWQLGPFESWDAIGVAASVERMKAEGLAVPVWVERMLASGCTSFYERTATGRRVYDVDLGAPRSVRPPTGTIDLAALKASPARLVAGNRSASLIDVGDGVLCLELHTKLNTIDSDVVRMLSEAVDVAESRFEALVIGNTGEHFCAGANLMLIAMASQQREWGQIEQMLLGLQAALQKLRYCSVPVVAAPFQYTLGGGAELAMAADSCQALAETYAGLVEAGVGLVPAGGGCTRMVERYTSDVASIGGVDLLPLIGQAASNLAQAKVSTSAEEAKLLKYLRPSDGVSLNPDRLLSEAKQRALGLAGAGYQSPLPPLLMAAGYDASKTLAARVTALVESGFASPHDALIANKIAHVLCGGSVAAGTLLPEQHFFDLEREAFLSLCGEKKSQERVTQMLMTGKPLRN